MTLEYLQIPPLMGRTCAASAARVTPGPQHSKPIFAPTVESALTGILSQFVFSGIINKKMSQFVQNHRRNKDFYDLPVCMRYFFLCGSVEDIVAGVFNATSLSARQQT